MKKSQTVDYHDTNVNLQAYCAYPEILKDKIPAVLICHDWTGRSETACKKAEQIAELGYIGFALDMFGDAKLGETTEEKSALIQPFVQDRKKLLQRIVAGLDALRQLPQVDQHHIAVIGFCFGGLCALDLARSGADIKGAVSFHGLLQAPEHPSRAQIKAKILVLHGYDDPMVTPDHVIAFANEMTHAKVDWQIDIYSNTQHAFTNQLANDEKLGTVYNKRADQRSWVAMKDFFAEIM